MHILGISIDSMSKPEAQKRLAAFFTDGTQHLIATPNPEIVLAAREDQGLADALKAADMNMPDGVGLVLAMKFLGAPGERYPGVELAEDVVRLAEEKKQTLYFLGDEKGSAEKAAMRFPNVHIIAEAGPDFRTTKEEIAAFSSELISRINNSGAAVVLAAFGHPRQEVWLHEHLPKMPGVKIGIGVGGTFDFWSGAALRAPRFMRMLGLEWLWRLFREPWRWRRIANAVIVFPVEIMAAYIDRRKKSLP